VKTVDLAKEELDLQAVIRLARQEPVLLVTPDGREFCIAEADDFVREVYALAESQEFQRFLDERSACSRTIPLDEIEKQIQQELAEGQTT